jgi:hypothetical protein
MISMGIDPGIDGYLCMIDGDQPEFWPMPTRPGTKGGEERDLDDVALFNLLSTQNHSLDILVVEEQQGWPGTGPRCVACRKPRQMQGVASTFKTGKNYGIIVGMARALGLPLVIVEPEKWKPVWGLTKDKAMSIAKAQFLAPAVDFRPLERSPKARVPDHNKSEALILAKHGFRLLKGEKSD